MRTWRRFFNMLLTAVVCLCAGMIPGKRVCAEAVQAFAWGEDPESSAGAGMRTSGKHGSCEGEVRLRRESLVKRSRETGSLKGRAFYQTRGPGDFKTLCFEDSG